MAEITNTANQLTQIPDWLRDHYLKMLGSAAGYIFGTTPRISPQEASAYRDWYTNRVASGQAANVTPRDSSDGSKWWGTYVGLNKRDVLSDQPKTQEEMNKRLTFGVAPDPAQVRQERGPWGAVPGYVSPWQQNGGPSPFQYPFVNYNQGGNQGGGITVNPKPPSVIPNPAGGGTNPYVPPSVTYPPSTGGIPGGNQGGGTPPPPPPSSGGITGGSQPGAPPTPAFQVDPSMWMQGIVGKNSYDGTEIPLNNMHFASPEGTKFALDQIKRLSGEEGKAVSVKPTEGPYSWPSQSTIVMEDSPIAYAIDGTPLGGMNAGAVTNLFKVYDPQTADIRLREELAKQGVKGMAEGGEVPPTDPGGITSPGGYDPNAVYGSTVSGYTPYPGQRFAPFGDLTNQYFSGVTRLNEGLMDPYRTIIDPNDSSSFALNRLQDMFTDPDMAIHTQIRNYADMPPVQNQYQANTYAPAGYSANDLMSNPFMQSLGSYGGGDWMSVNAPGVRAPQDVNTQNWNNPYAQSTYMQPFNQGVIQQQRADAIQAFNENSAGLDADAVKSGAFGGYRHGLTEGVARRELDRQLNDISATGLRDAYTTGLGAFQKDRDARLTADLANQNTNLSAQQIGGQFGLAAQQANQAAFQNTQDRYLQGLLSGSNLGSQAGLTAAQLNEASRQFGANLTDQGQQRQQAFGLETARTGNDIINSIVDRNLNAMGLRGATSMDLLKGGTDYTNQLSQRLGMLKDAGAQQDLYEQTVLDNQYSQFQQQQNYPLEMLNYYSGLLSGTPYGTSTTYSQSQPYNPYTQAMGLGIAGLGALGNWFGK